MKGHIIASYKNLEWCRARLPKRTVEASPILAADSFYYFSPSDGRLRIVNTANGEVCRLNWDAYPDATLKRTVAAWRRK